MIFLILGILFLVIGIPLSFYYSHVYSLPKSEKPVGFYWCLPPLFLGAGLLAVLLDILGVVFILVFIIKRLINWVS